MPFLYILMGSNGAGKSTVGPEYLPENIRISNEIFDGDKLFMKKRSEYWNNGIKSHKECKKLAIEFVNQTFDHLVENSLRTNSDFVYEGHFTNEATWDIPRRFRNAGYEIHLIYFGLRDTDISEMRVVARSREGGHYVDPTTVASNFYGNLEKLDEHFTMFKSVQIIDTSEVNHEVLAVLQEGNPVSTVDTSNLPNWFSTHLPSITKIIKDVEFRS